MSAKKARSLAKEMPNRSSRPTSMLPLPKMFGSLKIRLSARMAKANVSQREVDALEPHGREGDGGADRDGDGGGGEQPEQRAAAAAEPIAHAPRPTNDSCDSDTWPL